MHLFVVVPEVFGRKLPLRDAGGEVLPQAADREADLAAGVGGDGAVRIFCGFEELLGFLDQFLDDVHVQPQTLGLGANNATLPQRLLQGNVERLLKQHFSGT